MTQTEINQEVQARVEFKMNDFLTAVKNRLGFKYQQAFDMTRKSQDAWKAFEEVAEIIDKEIHLPTPYDNMSKQRKWEAKQKAVEKIVKTLDLKGRDYNAKINSIVSAVELAQDW